MTLYLLGGSAALAILTALSDQVRRQRDLNLRLGLIDVHDQPLRRLLVTEANDQVTTGFAYSTRSALTIHRVGQSFTPRLNKGRTPIKRWRNR